MQELMQAGNVPSVEITADLFTRFTSWIDRSDLTTKSYLLNLKQFSKWLQDRGIRFPRREDVIAYRDYLTAAGFKPATVAAYLRSVKQFFAWTSSESIYPNIAANIHPPKIDRSRHRKDAFTAAEVLQIEKNITESAAEKQRKAAAAERDMQGRLQRSSEQGARLYAMYLLAVNAGLRTVEISRARIKDLESKGNRHFLYVWGKGRSEADQKKPIPAEVAAAIRKYLEIRGGHPAATDPLFVSTGNRSGGKRIAASTISTMLKRALLEAGFNSERLTAHSLRHSAGTAAQEITGNLYSTQLFMRHSSPATTETYLHNKTDQQQADLAEKVYKYFHGLKDSAESELLNIFRRLPSSEQENLLAIAARMDLKAQYELNRL